MKRIYQLIIVFCVFGCDPRYCATYKIENNSTKDLQFVLYSEVRVDTLFVDKLSSENLTISCGISGGPDELSLMDKDSIYLYNSVGNAIRVYYPSTSGKNIYNTTDREVWIEKKKGKRDYEYTFEVTEDDI